MKKQAHPEVWARLEGQMRAGFEAIEIARQMQEAGEIKAFLPVVLSADPFVVGHLELVTK